MTESDTIVCKHCSKPIEPGQPWHTVAEMHYECYEASPLSPQGFSAATKAMEERITFGGRGGGKSRKPPCRPGDGPTARKLAKRLSVLVKEKLGWDIPADDFWFWVQPPEYRGPRWDLAVWGCHVKSKLVPGGMLMLNSWDTMTALLKAKHLGLTHEGGMEWGVGESSDPNEPVGPKPKRSYKAG